MESEQVARPRVAGVVPVVTIDGPAAVDSIADGLRDGGIGAVEITLRTPHGLEAIRRIRSRTDLVVGAGTVIDPRDARAAADAGAEFVVSPGLDLRVVDATREAGLLALPGIATPTELQTARAAGLHAVKVFPVELLGGIGFLDALHQPFPGVRFMPSGGVTLASATAYLAHSAVFAVGGSWIVPRSAVDVYDQVVARARATVAAVGGGTHGG